MAKGNSENEISQIEALLEKHKSGNDIISECLDEINNNESAFNTFTGKSKATSKQNVLDNYTFKASMEEARQEEKFVIGFDRLIPKLKDTMYDHIKVSDFITSKGTFSIFSDFEITAFIGILKSNRTLNEIKDKFKKIDN
jgi:hypothetical protein